MMRCRAGDHGGRDADGGQNEVMVRPLQGSPGPSVVAAVLCPPEMISVRQPPGRRALAQHEVAAEDADGAGELDVVGRRRRQRRGVSDFHIQLTGAVGLVAGDFVL